MTATLPVIATAKRTTGGLVAEGRATVHAAGGLRVQLVRPLSSRQRLLHLPPVLQPLSHVAVRQRVPEPHTLLSQLLAQLCSQSLVTHSLVIKHILLRCSSEVVRKTKAANGMTDSMLHPCLHVSPSHSSVINKRCGKYPNSNIWTVALVA